MRTLFCIKRMDDANGGAERVLAEVVRGLLERGHDVSLLTFDREGGSSFYPLDPRVNRICLGIGRPAEPTRAREAFARMRAIRRAITSERPDVVVAFMHSSFVLCALALMGTGIPVVASEHIVGTHYHGRPLEYALLILSGLLVQQITVLSPEAVATYAAPLRPKMTPIPNPVRPATARARPAGAHGARKVLLSVGRFEPQKDHRTLLSAFALLAPDHMDWDLRIIGDGPLRPQLERQIDELGLRGRVLLPGRSREIEQEYLAAHLFAIPSLYESFGLVTAEAMAHGLPVVGFADCPGTNELVVHGRTGLLVEGHDRARSLASGLRTLMESADRRVAYGEAGRHAMLAYAPDMIIDRWEQLLERVVS